MLSSNCHFIQNLFRPIVDRLGYVYLPSDPVDISQLRTKAIGQAAAAGDQAYVIVDMRRDRTMD
jgi:aminopeptidase 2